MTDAEIELEAYQTFNELAAMHAASPTEGNKQ